MICEETISFRNFSLIRDNFMGVMDVGLAINRSYTTYYLPQTVSDHIILSVFCSVTFWVFLLQIKIIKSITKIFYIHLPVTTKMLIQMKKKT